MRTLTSLAATMLLSGAAAHALGQTLEIPGTDSGAGAIQNPGAGLPGAGWQPLFEGSRDPDADLIFEVPVTLESIPRAIRIGGTGPLMTPNQLIVTCAALPDREVLGSMFSGGSLDFSSASSVDTPNPDLAGLRMLSGTTSIPLERIEPGVERVIAVSVTVDERLPNFPASWVCGMALWRDSEAEACPIGACALPDLDGFNTNPRPSYEPQPDDGSLLATEGPLPENL